MLFEIVFLIVMFYDLVDFVGFVIDVFSVLYDEGIWIIE